MNKTYILAAILVLVSFIAGVWLYGLMPEGMASHWDQYGQVNGYTSRFWGLFLLPIISVGMLILFFLIPKFDPLARNIEKFRSYYDTLVVMLIAFLFYIHMITLLWNLGYRLDFNRMLSPAYAILFITLGSLISHTKQNWSVGIRTPWTLSSELVWDKTHQFGGKLFTIAGVICLLGIAFPTYAIAFLLVPVLLVTFASYIYSYIIYAKYAQKTPARRKSAGRVR